METHNPKNPEYCDKELNLLQSEWCSKEPIEVSMTDIKYGDFYEPNNKYAYNPKTFYFD